MKNTMFHVANWMISDPRRALFILSVTIFILSMAFAAIPNHVALAEDIVGGS